MNIVDKLKENITCCVCSNKEVRESEIIETSGKLMELETPLKCIIIKKFICSKCKESNCNIKLTKVTKINKKAI